MSPAPVAALQKFIRPREPEERCDTCGQALTVEHDHTFDPVSRRIRCACDSCAILYATTYKLIPHRVQTLPNFQMSDAQWDDLLIPIGLAFFSHSTAAERTIALYPGPAVPRNPPCVLPYGTKSLLLIPSCLPCSRMWKHCWPIESVRLANISSYRLTNAINLLALSACTGVDFPEEPRCGEKSRASLKIYAGKATSA